ncbi:MAG TPA: alpha/beta hydrolase-fold protein [Candidatus Eisenbacteria bacterium]|nr:alpha/beta hydrolase-fold protein [Candidatus Eisenbacteria bacterium]
MPFIAFILWPVLIAAASAAGASDGHFEYRAYSFHGATAHFGVWLPPGYKSRHDWPAILYLHGADESGSDGRAPMRVGLGQALSSHPSEWPFVVIVPQKPSDHEEWWEEEDLTLDVVRRAVHEFHLDARKLALVGVSQGGHGAWMLGARHPTMWSCLVPISSYGRPRTIAPRVARLPVWAFHGDKDDVVNPAEAKSIVAAIQAEHKRLDLDIDTRLTVLPSAGHDAWDAAFANPELPRWILAQSKRP